MPDRHCQELLTCHWNISTDKIHSTTNLGVRHFMLSSKLFCCEAYEGCIRFQLLSVGAAYLVMSVLKQWDWCSSNYLLVYIYLYNYILQKQVSISLISALPSHAKCNMFNHGLTTAHKTWVKHATFWLPGDDIIILPSKVKRQYLLTLQVSRYSAFCLCILLCKGSTCLLVKSVDTAYWLCIAA